MQCLQLSNTSRSLIDFWQRVAGAVSELPYVAFTGSPLLLLKLVLLKMDLANIFTLPHSHD